MSRLVCLAVFAWMVAGCQSTFGSLLVRVSLVGDTRTACVTVDVGHGRPPLSVKRLTREVLKIGVSEENDLTGTVTVTVQRFATDQCKEPIGQPVSQTAALARNQKLQLDFTFTDAAGDDGGVDAGTDAGTDAGRPDAGCDLARCALPPECAVGGATCLRDGGCGFAFRDAGAPCADAGLCAASGACVGECALRDAGAPCDDGLACTTSDICAGEQCFGTCANHSTCAMEALTCEPDGGCRTLPFPEGTPCKGISEQQQCHAGVCVRTLGFVAANLGDLITSFPYPLGPWIIAPGCEVIIDTGFDPPATLDGGWCSASAPVGALRARSDAGAWAVLSATSLEVGADASVHFVGPNPVALVVLGEVTVAGLLSVAPTVPGRTPAGANDVACAAHNVALDGGPVGGGGGAGFGSPGGRGGQFGGNAGDVSAAGSDLLTPLRGGCRGGSGARAMGGSGGGALQLSVAGTLTIASTGIISASGEGGSGSASWTEGAGGGGSGGALLLEASRIVVNGFLSANGGAGGTSGGSRGENGALASQLPASGGVANGHGGTGGSSMTLSGGAGDNTNAGGGGGGAGVGRVRLRMRDAGCTVLPTNASGSVRADCL